MLQAVYGRPQDKEIERPVEEDVVRIEVHVTTMTDNLEAFGVVCGLTLRQQLYSNNILSGVQSILRHSGHQQDSLSDLNLSPEWQQRMQKCRDCEDPRLGGSTWTRNQHCRRVEEVVNWMKQRHSEDDNSATKKSQRILLLSSGAGDEVAVTRTLACLGG